MNRILRIAAACSLCVLLHAGEPEQAEWSYIPLHGGNGRLVKMRQHRSASGGVSVEIDPWTYEGSGRGPTLYVRAEPLVAILGAIRERVEAKESSR